MGWSWVAMKAACLVEKKVDQLVAMWDDVRVASMVRQLVVRLVGQWEKRTIVQSVVMKADPMNVEMVDQMVVEMAEQKDVKKVELWVRLMGVSTVQQWVGVMDDLMEW